MLVDESEMGARNGRLRWDLRLAVSFFLFSSFLWGKGGSENLRMSVKSEKKRIKKMMVGRVKAEARWRISFPHLAFINSYFHSHQEPSSPSLINDFYFLILYILFKSYTYSSYLKQKINLIKNKQVIRENEWDRWDRG